jgi:hypothetical protein
MPQQPDPTTPPGAPDDRPVPRAAEPSASTPTAAGARLDGALRATPARYHAGYEAAMGDLEAAVWAVVDELHAAGRGPEQVLVRVKAHAAANAAHRADLLDAVVRWSIARYYDGR